MSRVLNFFARPGYVAKGALYLAVGTLSAWKGMREGGDAVDQREAFGTSLHRPFGAALVLALVAGLGAYVLWRLVEALDKEKKFGARAQALLSAVVYTGLSLAGLRSVFRSSRGSGETVARDLTAQLMSQPFGPLLVGAVGAGLIAYAIYQGVRAYRCTFLRDFGFEGMSEARREWIARISRWGIGARGIVFALMGAFLIYAALETDPGEARGLGGTLDALREASYGQWLYLFLALGLAAYGVYCCLKARYGHFHSTLAGGN